MRAAKTGVVTDLRAEVDIRRVEARGHPDRHRRGLDQRGFPENNLNALQAGTEVEILFDVLPGRVYPGSIRSIGLGIGASQPTQPGTLPSIQNNRDWLRQAQRFPVQVDIDDLTDPELRDACDGGQASIVAYGDARILDGLAWLSIRVRSILSYAY